MKVTITRDCIIDGVQRFKWETIKIAPGAFNDICMVEVETPKKEIKEEPKEKATSKK